MTTIPGQEEKPKNEEELLRHALVYRSMQEAVLIFGPGGTIIDVNPATEKLFGWSRKELLGKKAETLNPHGEAERITADILRGLHCESTPAALRRVEPVVHKSSTSNTCASRTAVAKRSIRRIEKTEATFSARLRALSLC